MPDMHQTIERLYIVRFRHQLTLESLALYVGVSPYTLRNWLQGKRAPPDILSRLLDVLELIEKHNPEIHATICPPPMDPVRRPRRKADQANS